MEESYSSFMLFKSSIDSCEAKRIEYVCINIWYLPHGGVDKKPTLPIEIIMISALILLRDFNRLGIYQVSEPGQQTLGSPGE